MLTMPLRESPATYSRRWSLTSLVGWWAPKSPKEEREEESFDDVSAPLIEEKNRQPYVPSSARTSFLRNSTPRYMRLANNVL